MTKACQRKRHSALNGVTGIGVLVLKLGRTLLKHKCPHCERISTVKYRCPKCLKTSDMTKLDAEEIDLFKAYIRSVESCDALVGPEENGQIIKKEGEINET